MPLIEDMVPADSAVAAFFLGPLLLGSLKLFPCSLRLDFALLLARSGVCEGGSLRLRGHWLQSREGHRVRRKWVHDIRRWVVDGQRIVQ